MCSNVFLYPTICIKSVATRHMEITDEHKDRDNDNNQTSITLDVIREYYHNITTKHGEKKHKFPSTNQQYAVVQYRPFLKRKAE